MLDTSKKPTQEIRESIEVADDQTDTFLQQDSIMNAVKERVKSGIIGERKLSLPIEGKVAPMHETVMPEEHIERKEARD